jgi:hypothetical protein
MRNELRKSPPARFVALCFIFVVLLGNIWITYAVVGRTPPEWVRASFPWLGLATLVGGIWLGGWALRQRNVVDESDRPE